MGKVPTAYLIIVDEMEICLLRSLGENFHEDIKIYIAESKHDISAFSLMYFRTIWRPFSMKNSRI